MIIVTASAHLSKTLKALTVLNAADAGYLKKKKFPLDLPTNDDDVRMKQKPPKTFSFSINNVMSVKETTARISSPEDTYESCKDISNLSQECFLTLDLNSRNKLIDKRIITIGLVDASLVHAREVFRGAIINGATSLVLVHNHPGGDPTPSAEDLRITKSLVESGKILGMKILDHIIVTYGTNPFFSMRESGIVCFS